MSDERSKGDARRFTFSELSLARVKASASGALQFWDTGSKGQLGLSVLVNPSGVKSYRSTFYLHGRAATRKIGRVGELDLARAREIVREDRKAAAEGRDPREGRTVRAPRYEDVVTQFIELHAKPRQRSWAQTERILRKNCERWSRKPITAITKRDAYLLLDAMIAEGRGATAEQTLAWLRTMWRWAWKRDLVASPIMDAVEIKYEKKVRDRVYSDDEIVAIWRAAEKLNASESAYIKFLILLAPRKRALAGLRRSHLDDANKPTIWTTPFSLTKSRKTARPRVYTTPLPALAQRIYAGIPRLDDDIVFASSTAQGVSIDPGSQLVDKLVKHGAPEDFNYHAARHSLATWLENQGHSRFERGLILNHTEGGVTAAYSHGSPVDLKRALLEKWAAHVEKLIAPKGVKLLR